MASKKQVGLIKFHLFKNASGEIYEAIDSAVPGLMSTAMKINYLEHRLARAENQDINNILNAISQKDGKTLYRIFEQLKYEQVPTAQSRAQAS